MLVTSTSPLDQQSGNRRALKMDLFVDLKVLAVGGSRWKQQNVKERKSRCAPTTCRLSWTSAEVRRMMQWSG